MSAPAPYPASTRAVLAALGRGVLGREFEPGLVTRMLQVADTLPTEGQRRELVAAFAVLDSRAGALALTGRPVPVSWLTPAEAEALLQRWKASALPVLRDLANVVISLVLSTFYGTVPRTWGQMGYPGPLSPAPDVPKRLDPLEIAEDTVTACDVVVVGSGAGGGCAAARLAAAGLDVVVVEKGSYVSESDFHHREFDATREMYLYGLTLTTSDLGCRIIAGSTLGGGTVVNYTTSFKTPPHVLAQWRDVSGIDAFVSGEFEESLDEVSERLGVNTDSSAAGRRDVVLEEGLKKLGWHVDALPRAVRGCTQDEACGYCGFGCRIGAKQSTMVTYLQDAAAAGARIFTRADVRRVMISDGRATGVEARVGRHRLSIQARAVVVAAGAIETPVLLLRSGLRGQVGRNLRLHPGTAAIGVFDDDVNMWEGTLQARYSAELRPMDDGYGPIFETVPVHPGFGSAALPWMSARQHQDLMARFGKLSLCAVLTRDRTAGRVRLSRDGGPILDYKLTPSDERRIAEGVVGAARVLEAAGATEVFSQHHSLMSYRPGSPGAHEEWAEKTRRAGYRKAKVPFYSYHQMGSCRMGVDPGTSAVDADNESHEVRNLFVCDASAFPTASGVNPMLSIYGIANRAGRRIAERLS
ncbi:MAG TPA: GMC family oxidoreductase N-terminal domain-containing protein [Actinomycetota bacterium]|nr:GMC family oxidoreductase N-terminal domain-containing protein [Actinomycetota bacterium]